MSPKYDRTTYKTQEQIQKIIIQLISSSANTTDTPCLYFNEIVLLLQEILFNCKYVSSHITVFILQRSFLRGRFHFMLEIFC